MAFTVVDEYPAHAFGGGCFACASPRRNDKYRPTGEMLVDLGPLVDTVTDLDGNIHGFKVPILCETCIRELTAMTGGITPEQIDRDNLDHWKARAVAAEKDAAQLRSVLDRVNRVTA